MENDLKIWRKRFQQKVNELCGDEDLQFTAVLWGEDRKDGTTKKKIDKAEVCKDKAFPFLDMELHWGPCA